MKTTGSLADQAAARLTPKRRSILEVLSASNVPLSAYEIAEAYKQRGEGSIPPMSVYRILEFLEAEHLVHKLASIGKYVACTHASAHDEHTSPQFLLCAKCSCVKEINLPKATLDDLLVNVAEVGYKLVSPQFELQCICETCSQNGDT